MRWWLFQNALVGTNPILTGVNPAADAWQIGRHIVYHAKAGRGYTTVKTYLAGIAHMHVIRGLPNPTAYPFVRKAMKAYRRAFGKAAKPKKALTSWLLRKINAVAGYRNERQTVIWGPPSSSPSTAPSVVRSTHGKAERTRPGTPPTASPEETSPSSSATGAKPSQPP